LYNAYNVKGSKDFTSVIATMKKIGLLWSF